MIWVVRKLSLSSRAQGATQTHIITSAQLHSHKSLSISLKRKEHFYTYFRTGLVGMILYFFQCRIQGHSTKRRKKYLYDLYFGHCNVLNQGNYPKKHILKGDKDLSAR